MWRNIFKKRFYLFILIAIISFVMNFVVWNNMSIVIKDFPTMMNLRAHRHDKKFYELEYTPITADKSGYVREFTDSEKVNIEKFISQEFYHKAGPVRLYTGKSDFLNSGKIPQEISESDFLDLLYLESENQSDMDEILVSGLSTSDVARLEDKAQSVKLGLSAKTFEKSYESEYRYFLSTVLFTLLIVVISVIIELITMRILVLSSLKILEKEIRLSRLVGQSQKSIKNALTLLFLTPIWAGLVAILIFVGVIITASVHSHQLTVIDFGYLVLMAILTSLLIAQVVGKMEQKFLI
ncbi:hypothetical protein [Pseudolactococcus insecticola]|uniref:ABC transporter permease n=1 Tax=Pseudolactococcus insecticola TaxID=2709158 RepID=A0A6A0BA43_9LACT|nr:hypothetical protein [Lactococcus insecticola]GFH41328.1 hypothetical protein Hs20B_17260 [Lactococcus insecticola]